MSGANGGSVNVTALPPSVVFDPNDNSLWLEWELKLPSAELAPKNTVEALLLFYQTLYLQLRTEGKGVTDLKRIVRAAEALLP